MNFEERLTEALDSVLLFVKEGMALAKTEVPIVINELLAWGLWSSVVWLVIGVLLLGIGIFFVVLGIKESRKNSYSDADIFYFILSLIFSAAGIITSISHTLNIIQINVAPRVYLIEKISTLM